MLIEEFGRDYGLIAKSKPMFQKSANKNIVYAVNDLFLQFWFRFIYKYNYFIEANAYKKLAEIVERDYETYSGKVLDRYFKEVMKDKVQRFMESTGMYGKYEVDVEGLCMEDM